MKRPCGLALLWLILPGGLAAVAAEQPNATPQEAIVVEREEIVEAQHAGQNWTSTAKGEPLKVRDKLRTGEFSRAAVRLTDLSMLRVDELTTIEISAAPAGGKANLGVQQGSTYFFSREKAQEMEVHTPAANGALRGTEFVVRVSANGKTTFTMLDGQVDLGNAQGHILLHTGEQGEAEIGRAPHKTAVIDAKNIIQWCLYYPAVLDPDSLGLSPAEVRTVSVSLAAYRSGDLLRALAAHSHGGGGSPASRAYAASVMLAVGQVEKARAVLAGLPASNPNRRALEQMIATVRLDPWPAKPEPTTSSEWLARSYYEQSQGALDAALKSARQAAAHSPSFGYAWARIAELEFSFGHTSLALAALDHALELTPRNAQAHALQGFLLSAENKIGPARQSFDAAIDLDGALGNAWLGRGLTYLRQGHAEAGRYDLQTAAILEPNRSLLRSYLGKAFSQQGLSPRALSELSRAEHLDPNDPTPWLYSAIEAKQENRYNDAIRDLEQSIDLNDNRRIYRSQFLLDQDKSVRSANLAAIYRNDGLVEQSVREAVVAVNDDYANASTHLFLSNSYDALRDPNRVQLRYETAWFNELLLSNLLSPVGGGPLSQFVSQQEYSKLFESDGLGISSSTDYFSNGELHETASQFGTSGNLSYALDAEYLYERGYRTNDTDSLFESYATFKLQVDPHDTLFLKLNYQEQRTGDIFNSFDPRASALTAADRTEHFHEAQEPGLILLGLHHDWAPGIHTLLLFGRLANDQSQTQQMSEQAIVSRDIGTLVPPGTLSTPTFGFTSNQKTADLHPFLGQGTVTAFNSLPFNSDYGSRFEIYTGEIQQIVESGPMTFIGGLRYQKGRFTTDDTLTGAGPSFADPTIAALFNRPAARDADTVDFQRINLYAYDIWRITRWLSLTGGVTWDKLTYPTDFRSPPVSDRASNLDKVSPKVGFIFQPTRSLTLRGAYAEAISGASFDESIRLEPTQVAGFNQAYRTIVSEDLIGSIAGAAYKTYGLSLEQKLPTGTYWGVEYDLLQQNLDRSIGVFDFLQDPRSFSLAAALPSSLRESIAYHEQSLTVNLNQIVGANWSFGARFQFTHSALNDQLPDVSTTVLATANQRERSDLYQASLFALYNHPSGFFARFEANWYKQDNDGYPADSLNPRSDPAPGDDFWQLNILAGWRFYKNQCELSCGVLNLANRNYELEPLNPYIELPRQRTLVVHCKFDF